VHEKTVRRRRAVLLLLVVLSLILLTAYFGEAPGGRLHSVQRGFLTVISPIQDGADKALKPVRDLFGWFGDTLHAKGQRDQLRGEVEKLQKRLVANQAMERQNRELLALFHMNTQIGASGYQPVSATVVATSPNLWNSTVDIDKGTSAGVHTNDPVINGEGLVGVVTEAVPDGAQVSLITDSQVGVTAMINSTGATGELQPKVGDPNDLLLEYLPPNATANPGDYVVTAGSTSGSQDSIFPRGIIIGEVTSVDHASPFKSVNVHPTANLHNLDTVEVLRNVAGGSLERIGRAVASLPAVGKSSTTGSPSTEQLAAAEPGSGP
jgi:rod shape-determining protein MreC